MLKCPIISTDELVCDIYFIELFFAKHDHILIIFDFLEMYTPKFLELWFQIDVNMSFFDCKVCASDVELTLDAEI